MTTGRKWIAVGILLPLVYLLAYGHFRSSRGIVHFQNLGMSQGAEVKAPHDPWNDLFAGMAGDSNSIFLKAYASFSRTRPGLLNGVYWPLRKLECAYWNAKGPMKVASDEKPN